MSYDLYLLDLSLSDDAEEARHRVVELNGRAVRGSGQRELKQRLARVLMDLDPRYEPFEKDFAAIAEFENIPIDEARRRYDEIELNGPSDEKLAQFVIHGSHIVILWYSGTTGQEMDRYLRALCRETGYAVFDPQTSSIARFTTPGADP